MDYHTYDTVSPMTPSLKRSAPSTLSKRGLKKQRIDATTIPRRPQLSSPSQPRSRHIPRTPQHRPTLYTPRRRETSLRVAVGTPDRFVSNRANTDVSKVRGALLSGNTKKLEQHVTVTKEYTVRLRQSLFGSPVATECLLSFSREKRDKNEQQALTLNLDDPFRYNLSRHVTPHPPRNSARLARKKAIQRTFRVNADGMCKLDGLKLISHYKGQLAVALHDQVYLFEPGKPAVSLMQSKDQDEFVSCVQWSPGGTWIAVGLSNRIEIYCPRRRELGAELFPLEDNGLVTALTWRNDHQLAAANAAEIMVYDMTSDLIPVCYESDGRYSTRLVWNSTFIANAIPDSGFIYIYNHNQANPVQRLEHKNVMDVKQHPFKPSILVSCGDGGLRFWEACTGKMLYAIDTDAPVTGFDWSPFRQNEIAMVQDDRLSLWKIRYDGDKLEASKLEEEILEDGEIREVVNANGGVVVAQKDEVMKGFNTFRGDPALDKKKPMEFGFVVR